ncbi:MAG: hypothetical protein WCK39_00390 [Methanomassiliicoccales archaeon]
MATSSFDRPFILQDDEAVLKFLEAMEHPAPPFTPEEIREFQEMLEGGRRSLAKMSSRSKD